MKQLLVTNLNNVFFKYILFSSGYPESMYFFIPKCLERRLFSNLPNTDFKITYGIKLACDADIPANGMDRKYENKNHSLIHFEDIFILFSNVCILLLG
ncbi:unnamed protein product [Schistosoma curassoni]|nr:unnamed protein product [Schistosoma curassoni]